MKVTPPPKKTFSTSVGNEYTCTQENEMAHFTLPHQQITHDVYLDNDTKCLLQKNHP